jgi:hypothetical protein
MDRGDHRHRQGAPLPGALLRAVGDAVGALGEIAHPRNGVAVRFHGGEASHVEAGAEGLALARQHDAAQAFHLRELVARFDDAFEHRGVERVHLVGAAQAHVGDAA